MKRVGYLVLCMVVLLCMSSMVYAKSGGIRESELLNSKAVEPAKLTKKNLKARKAYKKYLEKSELQKSEYINPKFALLDVDKDGIDELYVDHNTVFTFAYNWYVCTYKNGKMKVFSPTTIVPKVMSPLIMRNMYSDGTFYAVFAHTNGVSIVYCKVKNGSVKKVLHLNGIVDKETIPGLISQGYISKKQSKNIISINLNQFYMGDCWYFIHSINGKNSSASQCRNWIKKFESTHKKINPFVLNTKKNRNNILKRKNMKNT